MYNLKFNVNKTKYTVIGIRYNVHKIDFDGNVIDRTEMNYLGVIIDEGLTFKQNAHMWQNRKKIIFGKWLRDN